MSKMSKASSIDRELLHGYLYLTRDHRGMVSFSQKELAELLHCSVPTVSRLFSDLLKAGKLKRIKARQFKVVDPLDTIILQ